MGLTVSLISEKLRLASGFESQSLEWGPLSASTPLTATQTTCITYNNSLNKYYPIFGGCAADEWSKLQS